MKVPTTKSFFITLGLLSAAIAPAQTNVFPASGNVGIGTTAPGHNLEVDGDERITGSLFLFNTVTNPASGFSNQLGAGFNAATGRFEVATDDDVTMELGRFGGTGSILSFRYAGTQVGHIDTDGTNLSLSSNGGLSLNPNGGNVGIGTTNPGGKLDVLAGINSDFRTATASGFSSPSDFSAGGIELLLSRPSDGSLTNGLFSYTSTVSNDNLGIGARSDIVFMAGNAGLGAQPERMRIQGSTGNVGIGTVNPTYPLTVNGAIRAKEVIVETGWSDYVFDSSYRLMPLDEEAAYIRAHRHLPDMPSAADVAGRGVDVGHVQAKLLSQVEQLTLHAIEQERQLAEQARLLGAQQEEIRSLKAEVVRLSVTNQP